MSPSIPLITDLSWKSERLVYRAIDKHKDRDFIEWVHNIPLVRSTFESNLTAPTGKGYAEDKLRQSEDDMVQVAICLLDKNNSDRPGTMIGLQRLCNVDLTVVHHRNRQFAIVLDPAYHGKGYGTEALNWLCKIGFQYAGLHRIQANCFSINLGGLRCYEKVGFKVEGEERDAYWYNGHWVNRIRVGILEDEWRALQQSAN